MSDNKRFFLLILIMMVVSSGIGIAAVGFLYDAAFEEQRQRLIEIAKSHARLIEAVARFDQTYAKGYPNGAREATLAQIRDAHETYEGFGKTGEFTLAQREADSIQFILSFRHAESEASKRIPFHSHLAEPMQRALTGHSGTLVGLDYRGVEVLAAYEPVATLDLGIVAKLDLAEIRTPFIRAGYIVSATALALIIAGTVLFFYITIPILQRIADSEEQFRSISTAAQDAIIMLDDRDRIYYWNPAAERIFGFSRDEVLGKKLHEWLVPERFRADHRRALPRFAASGQGAIIGKTRELVAQRKGGEQFPMELSVSSLKLKGRWYALGILRDITLRRRTEQLLKDAEARWLLLLNSTGEGIYGVDSNDCCTFVNSACLRMLGYQKPKHLLDKNIHPLIHHTRPDGTPYPSEQCQVYQSYRQGKKIHVDDEVFWRSDGTCFPVEYRAQPLLNAGQVIGCVVTFTDITERRHAEEALRRERDFAESLIETAQVIILVLDLKGRIVRFNTFMEQLSGYRLEEVRGKEWFATFLPERDRLRIEKLFAKAVSGTPTQGNINPIVTRDRRERDIEWWDRILKDGDDYTVGLIAIGHDITERKEKEAQLLQSQKMEVVGQLTGSIAHDFNNLLTVILGNLGLLQKRFGEADDPDIRESLDDALSAARDGADLTQRLLALSRKQPLEPRQIDINKIVDKLGRFLRRLLREPIKLSVCKDKRAKMVFVDPGQLESTMLNLAINARDAMPQGGTLTLDVAHEHLEADEATSRGLTPGTYVIASIIDSGIGISPEILPHVLEPFFTTKQTGKGTGLGLSMAYNFTKQSGGDLQIKSTLGKGTTVSLMLPAIGPTNASDVEVRNEDETDQAGGSETILIVEDEPRVRKLTKRRLQKLGYQTMEANDAMAAKEILAAGTIINLLFSDIVMPGEMNGIELAKWAISNKPALKVLLTTGTTTPLAQVKEDRIEKGNFPLLRKPYTYKTLARTIRLLLNE